MDHPCAPIRIGPAHIFETGNAVQDMQPAPSFRGFKSTLYPERPAECKFGYCSMIGGSSSELSIIYTVMKHAQKICSILSRTGRQTRHRHYI